MEVKDNKESISLVEEEIVDLPVAEEQADETNGGMSKASPKFIPRLCHRPTLISGASVYSVTFVFSVVIH